MGQATSLCLSPICSDWQVPSKGLGGKSRSASGGSSVVNTNLVPLLLEMLMEIPRILPQWPDILLNPREETHPLVIQNYLTLATWPISGSLSRQMDFLKRHRNCTVLGKMDQLV